MPMRFLNQYIKKKPQKMHDSEIEENFISLVPPDCVVNDDGTIYSGEIMTDISNLGDNLDIDNIDVNMINDEVIQILGHQVPEPEIRLNSKLMNVLKPETQYELNRLQWNQKNLPIEEPNVFLEIEKNIDKNDLPESVRIQLNELSNILELHNDDDFIKEFEKELNDFKNNKP